jgi:hypothetical protein
MAWDKKNLVSFGLVALIVLGVIVWNYSRTSLNTFSGNQSATKFFEDFAEKNDGLTVEKNFTPEPAIVEEAPTQNPNLLLYRNEEYGFALIFNENWKGYTVKVSEDLDTLEFYVPQYNFSPFAIQIVPVETLEQVRFNRSVVAQNKTYAFLYQPNRIPGNLKHIDFDIESALTSFLFYNQ